MKKQCLVLAALLAAVQACLGYEISVDTVVCNPGNTVCVPVSLDDARAASYAAIRVVYDPQILVLMKVEEGTLCGVLSDDFIVTGDEAAGVVNFALFGTSTVAASASGTLARLHFAVRDGTAGLYSDLTVTGAMLGDMSGVRDVTITNAITTVNGMVRVMGEATGVKRLENPQTIVAGTKLASLSLDEGDCIQASDWQDSPISVSGEITAASNVLVKQPVNGWASGTYALLTAKSDALQLVLDGRDEAVSCETLDGVTTYYATIALDGEVPVVCEDEGLSAGDINLIRKNARLAFDGKNDDESLAMKAAFEGASRIAVSGPTNLVSIIADMGIAPAFSAVDETGTLKLTYSMPTLEITSFNPETGVVRFKVTPGEGNRIVSEIATGYIHVYGTDNLAEKMKYISRVGFDLTPYLASDTIGEGVLNITLGSHTFLKVKVENTQKAEGDDE